MAARQLAAAERDLIARMPKAELHIHLEGSVQPATLLELGQRHGISFPFVDAAGAAEWFRFRDFPHFIELYVAICQALRSVEDYERAIYELARDAALQNTRYLEVTFAPIAPGDASGRVDAAGALAGLRAGARRALADFGVRLAFILDPVRTRSVDDVMWFARFTAANLGEGLAGFGLGGLEAGHLPTPFARAFAYARDAGARLSLHAGETAGPVSIRAALAAGAERIGHGVRAIEDLELVRELAASGVVLEVSPTSNLRLGIVPSYAAHPLRRLYDAGVQVTLNSDDPPMFDTTLTNEYLLAAEHFGFTVSELGQLSLRAARAAFLPANERSALVADMETDLGRLPLSPGTRGHESGSAATIHPPLTYAGAVRD